MDGEDTYAQTILQLLINLMTRKRNDSNSDNNNGHYRSDDEGVGGCGGNDGSDYYCSGDGSDFYDDGGDVSDDGNDGEYGDDNGQWRW